MGKLKFPVGVAIFIAIWLLIFCVPTVRDIPRSLMLYRQPGTEGLSVGQQISAKLARQLPNNATAVDWAAVENSGDDIDRVQLNQTLARFSNDLETRALWLRTCAGLFSNIDGARKSKNKNRIALWKEAAQIAHNVAPSEPRNAFWPWMEAGFEFGVGNDNAAYAAMRRAASCTEYNDYLSQTTKARVALMKRQLNASFEEKLIVFYGVFYSHWSLLGDAANLTAQGALELKRSGDVTNALALEDAVLNVTRVRRANSDSLLNALISQDLARKSLETFLGIRKPPEPGQTPNGSWLWVDPAIHGKNLANGWADFVRKNGRPELANSASFVGEPDASRRFNNYDEMTDWAQFGMGAPWGSIAATGPILLLVLTLTVFAGAGLWAIASPVRWRETTPTRGQVMASANFSFWLALGLCAVGFANYALWLNPLISFEGGETVQLLITLSYLILTVLCWLLPVWFLGWKRGRAWKRTRPAQARPLSPLGNRARKIAWAIGLLGLLLIYSNGRGLWDDTPFQFPYALWMAGVGLLLALSLELMRWKGAGARVFYVRNRENSPVSWRARFVPLLFWTLAFAALVFLVRGFVTGYIPFDMVVLVVPTLGFLGGALYVGWKFAPDHFRWQLAHRTLGALVLIWSIAFLFLALGLMPLRSQLNRNFDQRIQLGELGWMRQQAANAK